MNVAHWGYLRSLLSGEITRLAALQQMRHATPAEIELYQLQSQLCADLMVSANLGSLPESATTDRLTEAEAIIRELEAHEGAEGWSTDLRERLDCYSERYGPSPQSPTAPFGEPVTELPPLDIAGETRRQMHRPLSDSTSSAETEDLFTYQDPERHGITRLARWPEGLVLWHEGTAVWKSWECSTDGERLVEAFELARNAFAVASPARMGYDEKLKAYNDARAALVRAATHRESLDQKLDRVAVRKMELIEHLRMLEEGATLILCADNAGFGGPNNAITVQNSHTDWQERRFEGESLLETLMAAAEAFPKEKKMSDLPLSATYTGSETGESTR